MPKEFEKGKRYCFSHTAYKAWQEETGCEDSWVKNVPQGAEVSVLDPQKAVVSGIAGAIYIIVPVWCEELNDEMEESK